MTNPHRSRIEQLSAAGFTDEQIGIWAAVETWRLKRAGLTDAEAYGIVWRSTPAVSPEIAGFLALMDDTPNSETK